MKVAAKLDSIGTFRSEYRYMCMSMSITYIVLMLLIIAFRTNLVPSLLFNCSATGRSEGFGNIYGLKFKSRIVTLI